MLLDLPVIYLLKNTHIHLEVVGVLCVCLSCLTYFFLILAPFLQSTLLELNPETSFQAFSSLGLQGSLLTLPRLVLAVSTLGPPFCVVLRPSFCRKVGGFCVFCHAALGLWL